MANGELWQRHQCNQCNIIMGAYHGIKVNFRVSEVDLRSLCYNILDSRGRLVRQAVRIELDGKLGCLVYVFANSLDRIKSAPSPSY